MYAPDKPNKCSKCYFWNVSTEMKLLYGIQRSREDIIITGLNILTDEI